jgi:RNA polymerase sigma factor (sigma-70 family)
VRFQPTSVSDEQLLQLIRRGDSSALSDLFERYQGLALTVARRAGLNTHDAEEAASDAWVALVRQLARGAGPTEHFRGYLTRAVRNAAISRWRHQQHTERVAERHTEYLSRVVEISDEHEKTLDRLVPDPRIEWAALALHDLAPAMRAILGRAWLDEAPLAVIASELQITPGVAAARVYRARKALTRRYQLRERQAAIATAE